MDRIEFRRRAMTGIADDEDLKWKAVEVHINGRVLSELWGDAAKRDPEMTVPLVVSAVEAKGLDLWSLEPRPSDELRGHDGRIAVLDCSCGIFECGGVAARIEFGSDVVTWSNFGYANDVADESLGSVELGPFQFDRHEYEEALASVR